MSIPDALEQQQLSNAAAFYPGEAPRQELAGAIEFPASSIRAFHNGAPAEFELDRVAPPPAALLFVELLTGRADTECCFRTFSDQKRGGGGKNYTGALRAIWPKLYRDQLEGRGVFIIPNAGGHKDAEIQTVRAIWMDGEGASLARVWDDLETNGLSPHLICRREDDPDGHWHVYILADGLSPDEFRGVQRGLAVKYGTDKSVINPSRVMRLPGTFHLKPGKSPARYSLEDLTFGGGRAEVVQSRARVLAAIPPISRKDSPERQSTGEPVTNVMLRDMLRHIDPGLPRYGDDPGWLAVISALYNANVVTTEGVPDPSYNGEVLAVEWSSGGLWPGGRPANYKGAADVAAEWGACARNERDDLPGVGALINLARAGGYEGPSSLNDPRGRDPRGVFAGQLERSAGIFGGAPSIKASAVEPRQTHFRWDPYLPAGVISIIGGRGNSGKGLVSAHLAAVTSTSGNWPCGSAATKGAVLWCETEDPIAEVMVPRLQAAGADLDIVEFINPKGYTLDSFGQLVRERQPALIVLSPMLSFLGCLVDIRDEIAVRGALENLQALIDGTHTALLGIGHLNKKPDLAAVERLLGSVAFANYVRSVLLVAPEPDQDKTFRLAHGKHNLTVKGADWCYQPRHVGPLRGHTRLDWSKPESDIDTDSMFDKRKPDDNTSATGWLVWYLQEVGEVERKILMKDAEEAGYSKAAITKAQQRCQRVIVRHTREFPPATLWSLAGYQPGCVEAPQ
jgi:hypothetical protein